MRPYNPLFLYIWRLIITMAFNRIYFFFAALILFSFSLKAQNRPIGYWRSLLPYNTSVGVATDGKTLFNACSIAFFTMNGLDFNNIEPYSKVEGMSDVGMQHVAYDAATSTAILVYANGNIDLFKDNTFYNIPDLKLKTVAGSKNINGVYTENGTAYLSTSLGVIVVDMANYNTSETYQFYKNNQLINVFAFLGSGNYFYASTSAGLYRIAKSNPAPQNFQSWQKMDSTHTFFSMTSVNDTIYLSDTNHVYRLVNDTANKVFTSLKSILHIDPAKNKLLVCEFDAPVFRGRLKVLNSTSYAVVDSFPAGKPMQAVEVSNGAIWIADAFNGLSRNVSGYDPATYGASGPSTYTSYGLYAHNKNLWVAHGGYTEKYLPNNWSAGMSNLVDDNWRIYRRFEYPPFGDSIGDLSVIVKDELDGTVYAGSAGSGLFVLKQDGGYEILKQNSIFGPNLAFMDGTRQVIGLDFDKSNNLWVSTLNSPYQLYERTKEDGVWHRFQVRGAPNAGPLVVDNDGQIWFACIGEAGAAVFNPADSASYHLTTGVGFGNLPSNTVYCLACDKNNNIWIGTNNGIGIVSNCNAPFTQNPPCDAELPIVQYDQFAGYLFADNNVRAIAVDGANRKWIGTDNGVWLLSPDASEIIYRFTAENSPLPSNAIQAITIDKVTGDVYIGTGGGLMSYHSTATEGDTKNEDVLVYPNPVKSDYKGTIAIKGLTTNADVRITDINGQLVYRTKALGGQAVWSGTDYKGHRPQSGVYLIFATNTDGSEKYAGKVVFMH